MLTIIHQDIIQYGYHKSEKRIIMKKFYNGVYSAAFHNTGSIFVCDLCKLQVDQLVAK